MVKVTWLPLPCVLKNALVFISSVPRLILCSTGLGHLLLLSYPFTLLVFTFLLLKPKTPKSYLSVLVAFPYPKSLFNTFCSPLGTALLLIENTTIDPLHLWVIKKCFLAPLLGSVALLVSEAGKETFTFCVHFYCVVAAFCPYGQRYSWFVACGEPPHYCGGRSHPYWNCVL